jgi:hypothetical protein
MRLKWYDIMGLASPVFLVIAIFITMITAYSNNWQVTIFLNQYNEGWVELVVVPLVFVWSLISLIRVIGVYKNERD